MGNDPRTDKAKDMEPLKEIIHSLRAKKSLGQNFLIDPHILKRIVEAAVPLDGRTVIEIGAGPGGLSREILNHSVAEVFLVEQDARCIPYLEKLKDQFERKLTLLNADALTLPLHTLGRSPRKIIANLPYNISVPLLLKVLKHADCFESLTLMFQKEVANRLVASPNTSAYGRLSVMCQAHALVTKLFDLPPGAFVPRPQVTSTVVQLVPITDSRKTVAWEALETVTKAAFSKRRKMLRSSLKGTLPMAQLVAAHINPESRAEDLSVKEFCLLAQIWKEKQSHGE